MPATQDYYLLLGPDRPGKLQRVQALERALGVDAIDRHHLDASTVTAADFIALARQQPALSSVRLIVVDQAHRLSRAHVEALQQHADVIRRNACIVLLVETELSAPQPLFQAVDAMRTERFQARDTPAAKPFALTDALGRGETGAALDALHDQLMGGKEPLELLGLVAWQLQRWVMVKRLLGKGSRVEQVAAASGLKPWQVQRMRDEVAPRSLESLQELLHRCWQLDVDAKSGRAVAHVAIEQLVLEVCLAGMPEKRNAI